MLLSARAHGGWKVIFMKAALRFLAIFLVIGGIIMMIFANSVKEDNAPREVIINGKVSGYLGGDSETDSEMNSLTGIGVVVAGIGVVLFIVSMKIKPDQGNY